MITKDDAEYEAARKVYNAMIDRHPLVVVRAVDAADVMAAVNFARESGLDLPQSQCTPAEAEARAADLPCFAHSRLDATRL